MKVPRDGHKAAGRLAHLSGPQEEVDQPAVSDTDPRVNDSYRPRDQYRPANGFDLVDRHLSRATDSDESLNRYVKLLAVVLGAVTLSCLVFGAGVSAALSIAGSPPSIAISVGAMGTVLAVSTIVFRLFRRPRNEMPSANASVHANSSNDASPDGCPSTGASAAEEGAAG